MSRPKFIKGNLYYIKGYDVGNGGTPLKTYHDYVVRYLQRDTASMTTGQQIQILATNKVREDGQSYIGISLSDMDWRLSYLMMTQYFIPRSEQHRIIYVGTKRDEDCMDIKDFKLEDLPLCLGWHYIADELVAYLKAV